MRRTTIARAHWATPNSQSAKALGFLIEYELERLRHEGRQHLRVFAVKPIDNMQVRFPLPDDQRVERPVEAVEFNRIENLAVRCDQLKLRHRFTLRRRPERTQDAVSGRGRRKRPKAHGVDATSELEKKSTGWSSIPSGAWPVA